MGRSGRFRRGALGAAVAALLVGLAACSSGSSGGSSSGGATSDAGYQSQDGATTTWPAGSRKGPVEFAGTDTAGKTRDVAAWRGDVVVVNTWYAACPPCRAEAPDLVALADDDAARGLHVIGVNSTDAAGTAAAFEREFAVPYPSILDTDGTAVAALQGVVPVNAVPTTVVLDRQGRVAARILGRVDASTLRSIVDQVLAEPGGATPAASSTSTPVAAGGNSTSAAGTTATAAR